MPQKNPSPVQQAPIRYHERVKSACTNTLIPKNQLISKEIETSPEQKKLQEKGVIECKKEQEKDEVEKEADEIIESEQNEKHEKNIIPPLNIHEIKECISHVPSPLTKCEGLDPPLSAGKKTYKHHPTTIKQNKQLHYLDESLKCVRRQTLLSDYGQCYQGYGPHYIKNKPQRQSVYSEQYLNEEIPKRKKGTKNPVDAEHDYRVSQVAAKMGVDLNEILWNPNVHAQDELSRFGNYRKQKQEKLLHKLWKHLKANEEFLEKMQEEFEDTSEVIYQMKQILERRQTVKRDKWRIKENNEICFELMQENTEMKRELNNLHRDMELIKSQNP